MTTTGTVRNERLADAMARMRFSSSQLAEIVGVDPRTVDRWVADRGRIPRAVSRHQIAKALEVPVGLLWPGVGSGPDIDQELVALYPSRTAMPSGHVMSLLAAATQRVDILMLAGIWLWDSIPDFGATLRRKAIDGVEQRVCIGDPAGQAALVRGREEGIGDLLAARCDLAISYARKWLADYLECVRLHDTTLYASMMRFDDDVLINWHLYGAPAAESPLLHARLGSVHGIAESCAEAFDRVWDRAHPLARDGETSTFAHAAHAVPSPSAPMPSFDRALTDT